MLHLSPKDFTSVWCSGKFAQISPRCSRYIIAVASFGAGGIFLTCEETSGVESLTLQCFMVLFLSDVCFLKRRDVEEQDELKPQTFRSLTWRWLTVAGSSFFLNLHLFFFYYYLIWTEPSCLQFVLNSLWIFIFQPIRFTICQTPSRHFSSIRQWLKGKKNATVWICWMFPNLYDVKSPKNREMSLFCVKQFNQSVLADFCKLRRSNVKSFRKYRGRIKDGLKWARENKVVKRKKLQLL